MSSARTGYSATQIALHWATVILVIGAWATRGGAEAAFDTLRDGGAAGLPLHAMFGIAVLVLTLGRIALRLTRGAPPPPAGDPPAQQAAARWGHRLIYLLLVAVPVGGLVMWFSGQPTPHGLVGQLLLIVALGHALVALWHQYVKRDNLLLRMMRPDRS